MNDEISKCIYDALKLKYRGDFKSKGFNACLF